MSFFRAFSFSSNFSGGSNFGGFSKFSSFSKFGGHSKFHQSQQSQPDNSDALHKLAAKYQELADSYSDRADAIRDKTAEKADEIREHTAHKVQALKDKGCHHLAARVEKLGEMKAAKIEKLGECKADIYDAKAAHWQAKADKINEMKDDEDVPDEEDDTDDDGDTDTGTDDTVDEVKIFYTTVDAEGNEQQFTAEGFFQFATVELPEGTTMDEVNIDDILEDVLTDLEENGTDVGEVYQVTVVGTDADGNEVITDFTLGTDADGNTVLVPKGDDTMDSLSTGDASEADVPADEDDDEDDADH